MVDISQVYSGDSLKAADLQGRDVSVIIADVQAKDFNDGKKLIISFQGKKKTLVCNKTNANRIARLYGNDTDGWAGREIILYVDWVPFQGKDVEAIRVRPPEKREPVPPATPQRERHVTHPSAPDREQVVTSRDGYELSTTRAAKPSGGAPMKSDPMDDNPIPFAPEWR